MAVLDNISLHRVTKITLGAVNESVGEEYNGNQFRDITIEDNTGEIFTITVFADRKEVVYLEIR